MTCSFKSAHFFTAKIIVVKPVQSILTQAEKFEFLNKRSNILCKIKKYVGASLDPSSKFFFNEKSLTRDFF